MNAATLALIDAGIPLRAYVCACSASMAWKGAEPEPLVDVGHVEEAAGGVVLTVAALPSTGELINYIVSSICGTRNDDPRITNFELI